MKMLFVLNDAPYGSERTYNGARLAGAPSAFAEPASARAASLRTT